MILGIEVALIVVGLLGLIRGRLSFSKGREVRGAAARLCGGLCLLPIPLSMALGFGYGVVLSLRGVAPEDLEAYSLHFILIEAGVVILSAILIGILCSVLARQQEEDQAAETAGIS